MFYILRRIPQEGLEGESVVRIREALTINTQAIQFLRERETGNVKLHTKVSSSVL